MRLTIAMAACLLLSACGTNNFQFVDPEDRKTDLALSYEESLPGIFVNLDGYTK